MCTESGNRGKLNIAHLALNALCSIWMTTRIEQGLRVGQLGSSDAMPLDVLQMVGLAIKASGTPATAINARLLGMHQLVACEILLHFEAPLTLFTIIADHREQACPIQLDSSTRQLLGNDFCMCHVSVQLEIVAPAKT